MNKKGFTLIEIISIVVLLSIIIIIAVPLIGNGDKKAKLKLLESKLNNIEKAAVVYAQDKQNGVIFNGDCVGEGQPCEGINNCKCAALITIGSLAEKKYIEYDEDNKIINPIDKTSLNDKNIIIYKKYGKIYALVKEKDSLLSTNKGEKNPSASPEGEKNPSASPEGEKNPSVSPEGEKNPSVSPEGDNPSVDLSGVRDVYIRYSDNYDNFTDEKKDLYLQSLLKHVKVFPTSGVDYFYLDILKDGSMFSSFDLNSSYNVSEIYEGTYSFDFFVRKGDKYNASTKENILVVNEPDISCSSFNYNCGLNLVLSSFSLKEYINNWTTNGTKLGNGDEIYFRVYDENKNHIQTCYYTDANYCPLVLNKTGIYYIAIEYVVLFDEGSEIKHIPFYFDYFSFEVYNPSLNNYEPKLCEKDCLLNEMAMNSAKWHDDTCNNACRESLHDSNIEISQKIADKYDEILDYESITGEWYLNGEIIDFDDYK